MFSFVHGLFFFQASLFDDFGQTTPLQSWPVSWREWTALHKSDAVLFWQTFLPNSNAPSSLETNAHVFLFPALLFSFLFLFLGLPPRVLPSVLSSFLPLLFWFFLAPFLSLAAFLSVPVLFFQFLFFFCFVLVQSVWCVLLVLSVNVLVVVLTLLPFAIEVVVDPQYFVGLLFRALRAWFAIQVLLGSCLILLHGPEHRCWTIAAECNWHVRGMWPKRGWRNQVSLWQRQHGLTPHQRLPWCWTWNCAVLRVLNCPFAVLLWFFLPFPLSLLPPTMFSSGFEFLARTIQGLSSAISNALRLHRCRPPLRCLAQAFQIYCRCWGIVVRWGLCFLLLPCCFLFPLVWV